MMKKLITLTLLALIGNFAMSQCVADFTADVSGDPTVVFTNNSTTGASVTYYWDFGDGNSSTATNPVHTYAVDGWYGVCLWVIDSTSIPACSQWHCDTVIINNGAACSANFTSWEDIGGTIYTSNGSQGGTSYEWNIYDPSWNLVHSATTVTTSYQAAINGTHTICLTVYDGASICDTLCQTINVSNVGPGCSLSMSINQSNGLISSNNFSSGATSYEWQVYDPSWNLVANPTGYNFSYQTAQNGQYYICLIGYDGAVVCDSLCGFLNVNSNPVSCQANFYSYPDSNVANAQQFISTSTGTGLSYSWDLGDGNTSTQQNPYHVYATSGWYYVCLTVDDGQGCTHTTCGWANATGACQINFTASESGGVISTNNMSTGAGSYEWLIYDPSWNLVHNPTAYNTNYTAVTNGDHYVCLYAYDSMNMFCDSACTLVNVTGASGGPSCSASFTVNAAGDPTISFTNNSTYGGAIPGQYWDFGDGNSSSTFNANHTYAFNGVYTVCLYIWDSTTFCSDTYCQTIVINNAGASPGCSVSFNASETGGIISGSSTSTGTGSVEWWVYDPSWNLVYNGFGNNFNTIAPSNGTYTICLYGYDSMNMWCDSTCQNITVTGAGSGTPPCDASFIPLDSAGTVYFLNLSSGGNLTYFWDFGDGNTSTQYMPIHTYAGPGTYNACLTIDDGQGCVDTYCYPVVVSAPSQCNAYFVWFNDSLFSQNQQNTIYVFNLASGSNLTYLWDFGDGNTSTQAYPTHQYAQNGWYNLCLTVDDGQGCTHTFCDTVYYVMHSGGGFTINIVPPSTTQSVGIDEVSQVHVTNLYPNPSTDQINLDIHINGSENINAYIVDMVGKVVAEKPLGSLSGQQTVMFNVANLEAGMYTLMLQSNNSQTTSRFIKK